MFKTIEINNYRGLQKLKVGKLSRINLITGMNAAGKTSLLESIFLLAGATNVGLVLGLNSWRGESTYHPKVDAQFRQLFFSFSIENQITIKSTGSFGKNTSGKTTARSLKIEPIAEQDIEQTTSEVENRISGLKLEFQGLACCRFGGHFDRV